MYRPEGKANEALVTKRGHLNHITKAVNNTVGVVPYKAILVANGGFIQCRR